MSLDFGFCKSLTLGGSQCKIPINTSKGDNCVIHMAAKYKQAGKGRQELNSAMTYRQDLFRGGDQMRHISAGSYGITLYYCSVTLSLSLLLTYAQYLLCSTKTSPTTSEQREKKTSSRCIYGRRNPSTIKWRHYRCKSYQN